jgi:hypothetical protein
MSFLTPEPQVFINIRLLDAGRRALSLGQLTFTNCVFSDSEVDYSVGRTSAFDLSNSRVMSPKDVNPVFNTNFDYSSSLSLQGNQVTSSKQISTATTTTAGFFTGTTNAYAIDQTEYLGKASITYSATTCLSGGSVINFDAGGYSAQTGNLIYIPWQPIQNSGVTYSPSTVVLSANPTNALWYRVSAVTNSLVYPGVLDLTLDRPIPNFANFTTSQKVNAYFYPYDGVEMYYGSAATISTSVWNMNIVRTDVVEGSFNVQSGVTTYGSVEYAGAKHFFGFSSDTKAVGIIHFTNEYTGNTYAEQFVEQTFQLTLPTVMWHNIGADNGQGIAYGLTAYDVNGDSYYDVSANTTFRFLSDGIGANSNIIGRVYHKLKMAVITDQELLAAMTYKSNRNYTLPAPSISLVSNPKYPLTTSQATGLCKSGYTYFLTYVPENYSTYVSGASYGYAPALNCEYVATIDGQVDVNGNPQYLSMNFPSNSFPYLRSSANLHTLSGTGWNANSVQLLVNEQQTSSGYNIGNVPTSGWKRVSDKNFGGNGIYSSNTYSDLTIDPLKLAGYNFIVSQQDFDSGSTYSLGMDFTGGTDSLFFGDESFVFGNLNVNILATTYKSSIVAYAKNDELNSSGNYTFDSDLDSNTYITAVGILDQNNNLVAVGKPTYPIKKSIGRFLTFQLEIDF